MTELRQVLSGSSRGALAGARLLGRTAPSSPVRVTVVLARREAISRGTLEEHARLRPHERPRVDHAAFAARYGASAESIAAVGAYAVKNGLTVVFVDPARRIIELSGTAANMERAFGAILHNYTIGSHTYRARQGPLLLPEALHPHIEAVLGLDNRPVARPRFRSRDVQLSYYPQQIAAMYRFPPGDGSGQSIALIELGGNFGADDLTAYFKAAGIAKPPNVRAVNLSTGAPVPYGQDPQSDGEVMLDIEVAGAIAPGASIFVYLADNTDQGFYDAVSQAIHEPTTTAVSISWGSAEKDWSHQTMNAWSSLGQSATLLNVPVFVAAGDHGCSDEDQSDTGYDGQRHVDFPGTCPDGVISCGGTSLQSQNGVISAETVWNDDDGWATGGGVSAFFQVPTWQSGLCAEPGTSLVMRGVPDVAGVGDINTGIKVRVNGADGVSGGTSAVAPQWAALTALLSQQLGRKAGFFLPALYANPKSGLTRDISQGNNGVYGINGYIAQNGWDACTGLGSPIGAQILALLSGGIGAPVVPPTPVNALATAPAGSLTSAPQPRAVLPFNTTAATLYGQCVQAAYSMYDHDPGNLTPAPSLPAGYQLTAWVQMQDFLIGSSGLTFYGFIAQSTTNPSTFILAIRGTSNGIEWWDDANALVRTAFKVPGCGSVGQGFARIYDTLEIIERTTGAAAAASITQSLRPLGSFSRQVSAHLKRHMAASARGVGFSTGASLEITGHSLGAALATLYAMENACTDQTDTPLLCTFASPYVGDATFASVFNGLAITSWRIVNGPDIVPNLPPAILGFQHINTEQRFSSIGRVKSSILCWHSMSTYLSLLDPSFPPGIDCRLGSVVDRAAASAGPQATTLVVPGGAVTVNIQIGTGARGSV